MAKIPKIIGVSGTFQVGKDTFCNALISYFPKFRRFALADLLKEEIRPKLINDLGIDILNCTPAQKEIARPYLVTYGKSKRQESNNRYWIDKLMPRIQEYLRTDEENVALVSDVRYYESDTDEVPWVKKENNGILVHVSQYEYINGKQIFKSPANEDEQRNDPLLIKNANYRIIWPRINRDHFQFQNFDGMLFRELKIYVEEFIKWLKR